MYVYVTRGVSTSARKHNRSQELTNLITAVESIDNNVGLAGHLHAFHGYWVKRLGDFRLVGKVISVDGDEVLCLLALLLRGGRDYPQFMADAKQGDPTPLDGALDNAAVCAWLSTEKEKRTREEIEARRVPAITAELSPWLEPPGWVIGVDDRIVYESEDWVRRIRRDDTWCHLDSYQSMIVRIMENKVEGEVVARQLENRPGVMLATYTGRCSLLYSEFAISGGGNLAVHRALLLIAPLPNDYEDDEVREIVSHVLEVYGCEVDSTARSNGQISIEQLGPIARRAYPDYILYDYETWKDIEADKEANLALSPEEQEILHQVSMQAPNGARLPLFINGRAGSGKSTMLFYLFADYCHRKHRQELAGDPLFITYSDRLIETARGSVGRLLRSHYRFRAERTRDEKPPNIDAYFQPFQKLLLGMLPPDEQGRFSEDMYISFTRFKRMYTGTAAKKKVGNGQQAQLEGDEAQPERAMFCNLSEARHLSPELCWHIIRTLIKGYRSGEFLGVEDYGEIPRDARRELSVSHEMFKQVHDSIWERWYAPLTLSRGYWDDQDLVRRVLELECYRSEFAAVFCDEAQDFTRLELQLILRLLMLCNYDLGYQTVHSLPFAFGGDPLQTVNPTGFRWPALKAAFYDEVISALDPAREKGLSMSFHELACNYRSVPSIVRVGNVILLWRHVLFGLKELGPQQPWWRGEFSQPVRFILGKDITPEELRELTKDTMIIVPVEPEEESSYARSDEILRESVSELQEGPPKNVMSPASAKGLEFQRVVLYRFGEACDPSVWSAGEGNDGTEPSIEAEYFFNKLYVAATRSMKHLFIVDSEEGEERLWKYSSTEEHLADFLHRAGDAEAWKRYIEPLRVGTAEDKKAMKEDNPLANAAELKKKGLAQGDPSHLRRAKGFYSQRGFDRDANECEAWALKLEDRYREAGVQFLKLKMADEAWDCFWLGMCWSDADEWLEHNPDRRPDEVHALVRFMLQQADDLDGIKAFAVVIQKCLEQELLCSPLSRQWKAAAKEYLVRTSGVAEGALTRDEWRESGEVLEGLAGVGIGKAALDPAAACFYRACEWAAAVRCWEMAGITDRQEYLMAKSRVAGLPDGLEYLERAGCHDLMIEEWEAAGGLDTATGPKWLRHVGPALEEKGQYYKAFNVYRRLGNTEKEMACFVRASASIPQEDLWQALESLVTDLRRRGLEPDAIDVMNAYFPSVVERDTLKVRLQAYLVSDLAYSDRTPEDFAGHRRRYTGLIRDTLLMQGWRDHVSVKEIGSALERIGDFTAARAFYNRFTDDPEPELRGFARERWIAVMRKHEDWYRMRGDDKKRTETSRRLGQQAGGWQIRRDIPLPLYPDLDADVLALVPTGTQIQELSTGDLRFPVGKIEVTIIRSKRLVEITDHRSWQRLQVDFEKREIRPSGEQKIRQEREGDEVEFRAPASGYGGRAVFAGRARLELWTEGLQGTIVVRM